MSKISEYNQNLMQTLGNTVIKIKRSNKLSSLAIELELEKFKRDILKWSIVDCSDDDFTISVDFAS